MRRTGRSRRRRAGAIALIAGLGAIALAAVLATGAIARPLGFLHVRSNLSRTPTRNSVSPDLAVSPDGAQVVVVWIEAYKAGVGHRGHVYLRAASETGGGWSDIDIYTNEGLVFYGTDLACAYDAAVAVTGPTAHVAYAVSRFDSTGGLIRTEIRHKECDLSDLSHVSCDLGSDLVMAVESSLGQILSVDLALDTSGNLHVVWAQQDLKGKDNDIRYCVYGGGCGAVDVPVEGDNRNPAIAWADGYAHVVWEAQTTHCIVYWRRAGSGETVTEDICPAHPPGNPDVASGAGRVFVVWDSCADSDGAVCQRYHLAYRRSNDKGATWGNIREVGTDLLDFSLEYHSTSVITEVAESLWYLQPSIALNDDGWPAVVWHAEESAAGSGADYAIYYNYADTGTADSVSWKMNPPERLTQGKVGAAAVAVGQAGGSQPIHIVYMEGWDTGAWDVLYGSNEEHLYKYVYLPVTMRVH